MAKRKTDAKDDEPNTGRPARDAESPPDPADQPITQDESGRTAGPQDATGESPKPHHHQKADRADTSEE